MQSIKTIKPEKLTDVVSELGIQIRTKRVDRRPDAAGKGWGDGARHWYVTVVYPGKDDGHGVARRFRAWFTQGSAHTREPTAADVLGCMASDASGVETSTFADWCSEHGADPDSRKALATFRACQATAAKLRRVFGELTDRLIAAES